MQMEARCDHQFLLGKTILITGATGFLAKVLVERILHVQPNVNKLYLLLRADDDISARQRLYNEVFASELFRVLKKKWGDNFKPLFASKVVPVSGDTTYENLGIKDSKMRNEMWSEIDIVFNSAATTNFYERYDVALAINTFGALNLLNFSKKCLKIQLLVHVSTAYVCGKKEGIIEEKCFEMGETLDGASASYLDINAEKRIVSEKLGELQAQDATKREISSAMKHLGKERAVLHGWANTYTFTKAMGEMLLGHHKEKLDVIILRPTIIMSTIKDPFPGWIEGIRTLNGIIIGYSKGKLPCFIGDPDLIMDVIPGDMVVNFILAVTAVHALQLSQPLVYHVSSSRKNPLICGELFSGIFDYFTRNPWHNSSGNPVKIGRYEFRRSLASFREYFMVHLLLVKVSKLVNMLTFKHFEDQLNDFKQSINHVIRLAEIYEPFVFFKGIFDDGNAEKLLKMIRESNNIDADMFFIDPKSIDWVPYLMNVHLYGVKKYLME